MPPWVFTRRGWDCRDGNRMIQIIRRLGLKKQWFTLIVLLAVIAMLQVAAKLDPKRARAHLESGLAYRKSGRLKEALEELHRYVDLKPNDDYGFFLLGLTEMSAGDFDLAERSLQRARSLNPQRANTCLALGNLQWIEKPGAKDFDKALAYYQRARALAPQDASPIRMIATVYYRQRRYAEAAREFERVLRLDPTVAEVYYPLSLCYARIGEKAKSERCRILTEVYAVRKEAFSHPAPAPPIVKTSR